MLSCKTFNLFILIIFIILIGSTSLAQNSKPETSFCREDKIELADDSLLKILTFVEKFEEGDIRREILFPDEDTADYIDLRNKPVNNKKVVTKAFCRRASLEHEWTFELMTGWQDEIDSLEEEMEDQKSELGGKPFDWYILIGGACLFAVSTFFNRRKRWQLRKEKQLN